MDRHVPTRSSRRKRFCGLCVDRSVGSGYGRGRNRRADRAHVVLGFWGGLTIGRLCFIWINQKVSVANSVLIYVIAKQVNYVAKGGRTKDRIRLRLDCHRIRSGCVVRAHAHGRGSSHIIHWTVFRLVRFTFELGHRECLLMCDRSGPMFPIMLSVARHSIPHEIASGSVAWIQRYAGSAVIASDQLLLDADSGSAERASFGQVGSAMLPFTTGVLAQAVGIKVLQPATVTMLAIMTLAWATVLWFTRRSAR